MPKNAIIYALFGNNAGRIRLLKESIDRMVQQQGEKVIYLVHNVFPGEACLVQDNILRNVEYLPAVGNPILWQKEALHNLGALAAINDGANNLIFIDGDIIPDDDLWMIQLQNRLKENDWVHGGKSVFYLNEEATEQLLHSDQKQAVEQKFSTDPQYFDLMVRSRVYYWLKRGPRAGMVGFPGGVWGVTRSAWKKYQSWDLHNIMGGGDLLHFNRLVRRFEDDKHRTYGNLRALLFNQVLEGYSRKDPLWKVSYIDAPLYHLWHGAIESRKYTTRYALLLLPEYQPLIGVEKDLYFTRQHVLEIEKLVYTNPEMLLELNKDYPSYRFFLAQMAEYFISRQDINLETVNNYLQYQKADFCLTQCPGTGTVEWVEKAVGVMA